MTVRLARPDAPPLGRVELHVDLERLGEPACLTLHARLEGRDDDPTVVTAQAHVCGHDVTAALTLEV